MRTISMSRLPIVLVASASLAVAQSASGQAAELFRDSWFWGAKTGLVSVGTAEERTTRPTYGGEWLITRTLGGLYVHADYSAFTTTGSVDDPAADGGRRTVEFSNLRRVGFAALAFPRTFGFVRPYAGVGAELNLLGRARAVPDTPDETITASVARRIEDARSRAAVTAMAGAQAQFGRTAAFAQLTMMPASDRFLIDDSPLTVFEVGVRYRVGRGRDRLGR
jgi:hypothetical protein